MTKKTLLIALLLLSALACGGIGMAYDYDLVGEYAVWAPDRLTDAAIVQKVPESSSGTVVVKSMVVAFGWDDAFIIAKQHPKLEESNELAQSAEVDTSVTHWFIIDVANGDVHGPLTEDEYWARRQALDVPEVLEFSQTIAP